MKQFMFIVSLFITVVVNANATSEFFSPEWGELKEVKAASGNNDLYFPPEWGELKDVKVGVSIVDDYDLVYTLALQFPKGVVPVVISKDGKTVKFEKENFYKTDVLYNGFLWDSHKKLWRPAFYHFDNVVMNWEADNGVSESWMSPTLIRRFGFYPTPNVVTVKKMKNGYHIYFNGKYLTTIK